MGLRSSDRSDGQVAHGLAPDSTWGAGDPLQGSRRDSAHPNPETPQDPAYSNPETPQDPAYPDAPGPETP